MNRLQSRKLWVTIITGLIILVNSKFDLGLDQDTITSLAFVIATYIATQAFVDTKIKG